MPATLEALRHLADDDTLVFLFCAHEPGSEEHAQASDHGMPVLVDLIEAKPEAQHNRNEKHQVYKTRLVH